MRLFDATGKPEPQKELGFLPSAPPDTLALKWSDPIEFARWITRPEDLARLRSEGAPLAYTRAGLKAIP